MVCKTLHADFLSGLKFQGHLLKFYLCYSARPCYWTYRHFYQLKPVCISETLNCDWISSYLLEMPTMYIIAYWIFIYQYILIRMIIHTLATLQAGLICTMSSYLYYKHLQTLVSWIPWLLLWLANGPWHRQALGNASKQKRSKHLLQCFQNVQQLSSDFRTFKQTILLNTCQEEKN